MSNHSKRTFGSVDAATTSDKQPVLAPIQALFDGIAQRDKSAMLKVLLPDGGATIIRNGQILQFNLRALVERLAARTERSEERIYDSLIRTHDEIATVWDPLIRIDDDIAMVWARYEFLVHGGIHHYGTNVFNLVRRDERWLIAGVANNSRQVRNERLEAYGG
jgi:hypothetical protein